MNEKILIIIINYNNHKDTVNLLMQLNICAYEKFSVFLLDNASDYGDVTSLEKFIGTNTLNYHCIFIKNNNNSGFAYAVNQGLKYAMDNSFNYTLLINNDIILKDCILQKLLNPFFAGKHLGITSCKILFWGNNKIYSAGGHISFFKNIGHLNYYKQKDSKKFQESRAAPL